MGDWNAEQVQRQTLSEIESLRHRVDALEARLGELERRHAESMRQAQAAIDRLRSMQTGEFHEEG